MAKKDDSKEYYLCVSNGQHKEERSRGEIKRGRVGITKGTQRQEQGGTKSKGHEAMER